MAFLCLNGFFPVFNISLGQNTSFEKLDFQYQVLNPNLKFWYPRKTECFQFQLTCFSAFFYFTLCFCTSLSSETWNLQLISQLLLCWCSDPAFQNSFSNPYIWGVKTRISKFGVKIDIEKPEIGEAEYLVYFNRPTVINNHLAIIT